MKQTNVRQFFQQFPTDDACLEHLFNVRFGQGHVCPKCERSAKWYRLKSEQAYSCQWCGHHIHPMVGTIFEKSRTPLQLWFYAIFLFTTTRHGVSGKELQRQLGVTYKTAWRIGHKIREQMDKGEVKQLLTGHVEIDEAYVGGKRPGKRGRGAAGKTIVMGFKERGGRLVTEIIPNIKMATLKAQTASNVAQGTVISTDELLSYGLLEKEGYTHVAVKHGKKEWAIYDCRTQQLHHTNGVESFWRLFKHSVRGTHVSISQKHMKRYLDEFTFRANHRGEVNGMFDRLIAAF